MCGGGWGLGALGAVLGGRVAQAFSHFTVHESSNQICICDLQGVGGSLFTDPQIHSVSGSYGDGNLGRSGVNSFLSTHKCNEVCAALGLPPVEPKRRSTSGSHNGEGGMGMGMDDGLHRMMMRGGMGGGAGMTMPMQQIMEKMMQQMMKAHDMGPGQRGNVKMIVNGQPVQGGGGGGGLRRAGGGGGGADELRAAMRASGKAALEEEQRNLRAALAASGGGGGDRPHHPPPRGVRHGGGPHADAHLQRALAASFEERGARGGGGAAARRR